MFAQVPASTIRFMSHGVLSYDEAAALVAKHAAKLVLLKRPAEHVALDRAAGRVLSHPLRADQDQPPFARSTRDGFACRAAEARRTHYSPSAAQHEPARRLPDPLTRNSAWEIMTGAPVPRGADAVVMLEHVEVADGRVRLLPPRIIRRAKTSSPKARRRAKAMNCCLQALRSAPRRLLLPHLAACAKLEVFRRPRVAILATGDELVPVIRSPRPGQIRNSNAPMLAAMVAACGGEPWVLPIAARHGKELSTQRSQKLPTPIFCSSPAASRRASSIWSNPHWPALGARFHFTGVRIQPGKPLVFGEIAARQPQESPSKTRTVRSAVFGLPGNPVSSAVTFLLFAAPVLRALAGAREIAARASRSRDWPQT